MKRLTHRRRPKPQAVYVVFDSAPLAAFAMLDEAMSFVEIQRDPRRFAIAQLGVCMLFTVRRPKARRHDARNRVLKKTGARSPKRTKTR